MVKPKGSRRKAPAAAPPDDAGTRERILAAAHAVFLRRGTAAARTQEIADEAGVNKALLHYYFGTKGALAEAVFREAFFSFMRRFMRLAASPDLPLDRKVREVIREQLAFHAEHPYLAAYIMGEAHADPERVRRMIPADAKPPLGVLRGQLDAEIAAGRMRPMSVEQFMTNLMALILMPFAMRPLLDIQLGVRGRQFDALLAERLDSLADFFLAGMRP